ncbi:ABC transporter permease [Cognatishimia sp. SS12]|nr:ABC transporter permease [Cognatishimia sp. SS12]
MPTARPRKFASARVVGALMLREMATSYGRTPGGYLWAVLEPVAGITLLTLVFSIGFVTPALGVSFPMFYATGLVPFLAYSSLSGKIATALMYSKPLLAFPSVRFSDALLARLLLNGLTQIMVAYLVFGGIMLWLDPRVIPDTRSLATALALCAGLAMGIGTLNALLFALWPVWQQIWSVLMRPLFIVSGIFYLPEDIPRPYRDMLELNPLIHVVGLVRRGFYASYDAAYVSPIYVLLISGVALVAGLVFLTRFHRDLLQR